MGYKCVNCGAIKEDGSKVYFINSFETMLPVPTCSEKCAKEKMEFSIKILKKRINELKNTNLIEEIWK